MESQDRRSEARSRLAARAASDGEFRAELIADPRSAMTKEFGKELPESVDVRSFEEPSNAFFVIVPTESADHELDDAALEAVAGGTDAPVKYQFLWTLICN